MRSRPAAFPTADAAIAAKQMIEADLTGFDAHGIFRLEPYCKTLKSGRVNPKANIKVIAALARDRAGRRRQRHRPSGDDLCRQSRDRACARSPASAGSARATPITRAPPASMPKCALAHGMVGIYAAVSTVNHMAPWGGAEALMGTNPIAIGIPAGREAPVRARHRDLGVVVRHHPAALRHRRADAGRLGGSQQDRRADHRSEEGRGRRAAADRRPQGQRALR